jgi:hypothetical protein
MSANRFHKLISLVFAMLYCVVGLMGESLHYFRAESPVSWSGSQRVEVAGYYHLHVNDLQAHFHPYVRYSPKTGFELVRVIPKASTGPHERAFSDFDQRHTDHTSPLLGLIAKLKLSPFVGPTSLAAADALIAPAHEPAFLPAIDIAVHIAPRGPPAKNA